LHADYEQRSRAIITNVVTSLLADKTRVFQYVEFVYFRRWWLEQNATTQEQVGAYVGAREAQITPSRAHTHARACADLFLAFSLPLCATNTIPAAQVRGLVASKQLVFLTGGLCMNDEAVPFHGEIIDQMSWGHRFVNTTCCTVAAFVYLYSRLLSFFNRHRVVPWLLCFIFTLVYSRV
jgi:hypothetical protein